VLADFRSWLEAALAPPADGDAGPAAPPVDLHTLLGQFVALRHEVNLQTRAVRGQQEQNAETLRLLAESLDELRARDDPRGRARPGEDPLRPVLGTLIDLRDALALAARETRRGEDALDPLLDRAAEALAPEETPPEPPRSFWGGLFGGKTPAASPTNQARREQVTQAREALGRVRQTVGGLLTGYAMALQRLERALAEQGLEPIPAAGEPFDPERMEVLEVVAGSGRPSGEVIEEVRRGYLRQGRVFRHALVRVAKG
jgi:molecular chaperone GrpE